MIGRMIVIEDVLARLGIDPHAADRIDHAAVVGRCRGVRVMRMIVMRVATAATG